MAREWRKERHKRDESGIESRDASPEDRQEQYHLLELISDWYVRRATSVIDPGAFLLFSFLFSPSPIGINIVSAALLVFYRGSLTGKVAIDSVKDGRNGIS